MSSVPVYNLTRISASGAVKSAAGVIRAVFLFGGSANSSVLLFNAANGSGTDVFAVNALANSSSGADLSEFGGIPCSTAIYATLSGTGAVAYIWFE